jgi:hypothetical protein
LSGQVPNRHESQRLDELIVATQVHFNRISHLPKHIYT